MKLTTSLKTIAKHLIFWGLGFLLLWFAFSGQDFGMLLNKLQEIRWEWALLILAITILNHFSRAHRWVMTFQPLHYKPTLLQSFLSLMFGYLVSYAIPRMGEVSRCLAIRNESKVPVDLSLGTVVLERVVDVFCLGVVTLLAFLIEFDRISTFFKIQLFEPIYFKIAAIAFTSLLLLGVGFVVVAIFLFILTRILLKKYYQKVIHFLKGMLQGFVSIWYLKNKGLFLLHTLFIWLTYFLMTYLWFHAFDATSHLAMGAGLTMMVVGSLGRLVPVQGGGMGAYHLLFQQGMLIYGIGETYGLLLALVIHGFQSVYYLVVGSVSTIILMARNADKPLLR